MKKITAFDNAIANQIKDLKAEGINPTAFWAYRTCERTGNELIDFAEAIWDNDVAPIVETFNREGITEFTISSTFSSLIQTLEAFDKHGFRMAGLTKVNANYTDWSTGKMAQVDAILLRKA